MKFNNSLELIGSFNTAISKYFDCHSANETHIQLIDLVMAYRSNEPAMLHTSLDVANMVFFATNLKELLARLALLDFDNALGLHEDCDDRLLILTFFDNYGFDYPQQLISDCLQAWICPCNASVISLNDALNCSTFLYDLKGLIEALEVLNGVAQLVGGALCA